MSNVSAGLDGHKQLAAQLNGLSAAAETRIATKAVRAGLREIAKGIKSEATPFVAKTIGYRMDGRKSKGLARGIVGVNVAKRANKSTRWAAIQVVGSQRRYRTSKRGVRAYTGQIRPNPVVNQGLSASEGAAASAVRETINQELAKLHK